VTANGVGNAWVPAQVRGLRQRGLAVELVALRAPGSRYSEDPDVEALARETRLVYPLPLRRALPALLRAPLRFRGRLLRALHIALAPAEPTSLDRRLRLLVQVAAAVHLVSSLPAPVAHVHADMAHAPASVGLLAATLLGVGFSFTGHANDLFPQRVALRRKLREARFVVAISRFHGRLYLDEGLDPARLVHVPVGVAVEALPPVAQPGADADEPLLLAAGRLVPKKGLDVLVDACARLARRGVPFRAEIAGTGPELAALRARAAAAGLGGRVRIPGRLLLQEELLAFLRRGHVFCLPCRRASDGDVDGLPLVLLEAACTGLPLVSTAVAGIPDLVEDGVTGLLVGPDDAEALADALEALLRDPLRRATLGAAARRRAAGSFDLAACLDRLAAHLGEAAGREAPPA
jgi:glycosyltransferase involved in cell wall biosynthesis